MGITNKWLNPYQRSYQQIKAKLVESLMGLKDPQGQKLITDYSEGNILIIILSLFANVSTNTQVSPPICNDIEPCS
jgi:hypothetical protein